MRGSRSFFIIVLLALQLCFSTQLHAAWGDKKKYKKIKKQYLSAIETFNSTDRNNSGYKQVEGLFYKLLKDQNDLSSYGETEVANQLTSSYQRLLKEAAQADVEKDVETISQIDANKTSFKTAKALYTELLSKRVDVQPAEKPTIEAQNSEGQAVALSAEETLAESKPVIAQAKANFKYVYDGKALEDAYQKKLDEIGAVLVKKSESDLKMLPEVPASITTIQSAEKHLRDLLVFDGHSFDGMLKSFSVAAEEKIANINIIESERVNWGKNLAACKKKLALTSGLPTQLYDKKIVALIEDKVEFETNFEKVFCAALLRKNKVSFQIMAFHTKDYGMKTSKNNATTIFSKIPDQDAWTLDKITVKGQEGQSPELSDEERLEKLKALLITK